MFKLKDKVVYPGHGVAVIEEIIEKKVAGLGIKFFKLNFLHKDMTILLPVNSAKNSGVRFPVKKELIEKIFAELYKAPPKKFGYIDFTPSGWNRRNKEYQLKLQGGKLFEIAQIYKDLMCVAQQKDLSFGERKLLQMAEDLLVQEIQVVKDISSQNVLEELHSPFKQFFFNQDVQNVSSTAA